MKITYADPRKLKESARNARTHSAVQVEQLANVIKRFGFTNPILVDERGEIIAGHGRRRAAIEAKLERVPTIVLKGLSKNERRALMLADNRIALNAGWDEKILAGELKALRADDMDLAELGFSEGELERMLASGRKVSFDTKPQLGDGLQYRVVVDCKSEDDQARLLEQLEKQGRKCRPLIS